MKQMNTMKFTSVALKNLFSKPATRPYPEQPREYPDRTRGHVEVDIDTCVLCSLCARKCPTGGHYRGQGRQAVGNRKIRLHPVRVLRGNLPEEMFVHEAELY